MSPPINSVQLIRNAAVTVVMAFVPPAALAPTVPATVAPAAAATVQEQISPLQPLRALIGKAESDTVGGYNAANNGRAMDLGRNGLLSVFEGRDCSEVTIGEIMLAQDQGRLHAAGRFQIIGKTMPEAVRWAGLSGADMFNRANQDRLFRALVEHKRPEIWEFLTDEGSIEEAANELAKEWASMPYEHGRTYYGAGDRAHASRAQVLSVLEQTRKAYQES